MKNNDNANTGNEYAIKGSLIAVNDETITAK